MKTKKLLSAMLSAAMLCGTLSALPVSAESGYGVKNSSGSTSFSPLANYLDFDLPLKTVPAEYAGEFCSVSASMRRTGIIVSLPEAPEDTVKIGRETCTSTNGHWQSAHYAVYACGDLVRSNQELNSDTYDYGCLKATDFYPEQYEEYLGLPVTLLEEDSPYYLVQPIAGGYADQSNESYEALYGALVNDPEIKVEMIAYQVDQTYDQYRNYIEIVYTEGSDAETMRPVLEEYGLDYSNPDEVDAPDCLYYSGDAQAAIALCETLNTLDGIEYARPWYMNIAIGGRNAQFLVGVAPAMQYKADSTKNGYGVYTSPHYPPTQTSFSPLTSTMFLTLPLDEIPEELEPQFCSIGAEMYLEGIAVSLVETPAETVQISTETFRETNGKWQSAHYELVTPADYLAERNAWGTNQYCATNFDTSQYADYLGVPVTEITADSTLLLAKPLTSLGMTAQEQSTRYEALYGLLENAENVQIEQIVYSVGQTYNQFARGIRIVYAEGADEDALRPVIESYGLDPDNTVQNVDIADAAYFAGDAKEALAVCAELNALDGIEYALPVWANYAIPRETFFLAGVAPVEWYPKTYGAQVGSYTLSFSPLQTGATLRLPAVDVEESYTGQFCSVGAEIGFTGIVISLPETPAETAELFGETFTRYDGSWRSEHFALYTCADYIHVNCDLFDYGFSYLQAKTLYPEQYTAYLHVPFTALDVESPYYIVTLHTAGVSIETLYKRLETDANTTIEGCAYHVRQTYNEYHNDIIIRYTSEEAEAALRPTLEAKGLDFETEPFDYDSSAVFSGDAAAAAKLCEELNALEGIAEIYPAYENIAPAGRDANLLAMVPVAPAGAYIGAKGDLDDDGEITARDAQTALMAAAAVMTELEPALNTPQMAIADIDGDGTVTPKDAQSLLVYAAKVMSEQEVSWDMILGTAAK